MISALSGSTSAQLLSIFARPQNTSTDATEVAQRPKPPPGPSPGPPPSAGNGASPKSLFDAMSADDTTSSDATGLDDLLSNLLKSLDTDGDGKLSADELKAAVATLQGDTKTDTASTDTASTDTASTDTATSTSSSTDAKSLYESLFNAMASMAGTKDSSGQMNDLSQKLLTTLTA